MRMCENRPLVSIHPAMRRVQSNTALELSDKWLVYQEYGIPHERDTNAARSIRDSFLPVRQQEAEPPL